jgi:hypothetical protein
VTARNIKEWIGEARVRVTMVEKGDHENGRMGRFRKQNEHKVNSRRVAEDE